MIESATMIVALYSSSRTYIVLLYTFGNAVVKCREAGYIKSKFTVVSI